MQEEQHLLAALTRPADIMAEVQHIIALFAPDFDFSWIMEVYQDIVRLFEGNFSGYQKCNTRYHDLRHTEDCVLELAKLMHGAFLHGYSISPEGVNLGIISALLHDTGYIQKKGDRRGTGAKYTLNHVQRSIDFMKKYFELKGYPIKYNIFCQNCLKCTGININIKKIRFISKENELVGKMLGAADLIGQMSDTNYLEKLPFLFEEFQEGGVTGFPSERDLLEKTPDFWELTQNRFRTEFGNVDRFLKAHFRARWGIDEDLDRWAVEQNIHRLKGILRDFPDDWRGRLTAGSPPAVRPPGPHLG